MRKTTSRHSVATVSSEAKQSNTPASNTIQTHAEPRNNRANLADMSSRRSRIAQAVSVCILGVGASINPTLNAATLTVDTAGDGGSGCTIRAAIETINQGSASARCGGSNFGQNDTINFAAASATTLAPANGELLINSNVTINGASSGQTIISGGESTRIFNVANLRKVDFNNLDLSGGAAVSASPDGGAILGGVASTITLNNSTVTGSSAYNDGGGISLKRFSTLTVTNSTISNNTADRRGGGIHASPSYRSPNYAGTVIDVIDSKLERNYALGGEGGGLYSSGNAHVTRLNNAEVLYNRTSRPENLTASGGGVYAGGGESTVEVVDSTFFSNTAMGVGGGIYFTNSGEIGVNATITGSEFRQNVAMSHGGGVALLGSGEDGPKELTIKDSIIDGNIAGNLDTDLYGGGGIFTKFATLEVSDSEVTNNVGGEYGGGIVAARGKLYLDRVSVSNNRGGYKGGGIYAPGTKSYINYTTIAGNSTGTLPAHHGGGFFGSGEKLIMTNSTVSGNSSSGQGGGIFQNNVVTLQNVTIADNMVASSSVMTGGGVHLLDSRSSIRNTIITGSVGGTDCYGPPALPVDVVSIISDGSCNASRTGDPGIFGLSDNGGPTMTHGLMETSIALNSGDGNGCPTSDQRGFARNDGMCDVGAVEGVGDSPPPPPPNSADDSGFFTIKATNGRVFTIEL